MVAEALVADCYLRHLANKSLIGLFGALLAAIGLSLLGWSSFWLLEGTLGAVSAAAVVGTVICLSGAALLLVAARLRPTRELELAIDIRRTVRQDIEEELSNEASNGSHADARALNPALEALLSSAFSHLITLIIYTLRARGSGDRPQLRPGTAADPAQDVKGQNGP